MACLLLSLNMAPVFAASQLWFPLFSGEGKGDLCFKLRPIIIVISTTGFGVIIFFHMMYDMGKNLQHEPFGEQIYVCFPLKFFFPFLLLADFVSVCFRHLLHWIDHFYFLSDMKKLLGAKACDSK